MNRQQAGRLGGLTSAHRMTPEERQRRAMKGGEAVLEKHGPAHFYRMNLAKEEKRKARD